MQIMKLKLAALFIVSLIWCVQSDPQDVANITIDNPNPIVTPLEYSEFSEPDTLEAPLPPAASTFDEAVAHSMFSSYHQ